MPSKHDDIPTVPLFDEPPRTKPDKPASVRSVTRGRCPSHVGDQLTGIVRGGAHLFWRDHYVTTWSGAPRLCNASSAPLHNVPAKAVVGDPHLPICPCGQRPTGDAA